MAINKRVMSRKYTLVAKYNEDGETGILERYKVEREYDVTLDSSQKVKEKPAYVKTLKSERKKLVASWQLKRIPRKEIKELRQSGKPCLLIKNSPEEYYYTFFKMKDFNLLTESINEEEHLCAEDCVRTGCSLEEGGCPKVGNRRCNHIEAYDFITRGYETFNLELGAYHVLSVSECKKYWKSERKPEEKKTKFILKK